MTPIRRPCQDCGQPYTPRPGVARCSVHQQVYVQQQIHPLNSPKWLALRKLYLALHPDCEDCGVHSATQVQHLHPRSMGGALLPSLSGLRALCVSCHSKWTRREQRFGYRPPVPDDDDDDHNNDDPGPFVA